MTSEADESTIRRWRKEYGKKMMEWAGKLEDLVSLYEDIPEIIQLVSHPLKNLEQILSFLPALPVQWTVMSKTLWWLKKSHPL